MSLSWNEIVNFHALVRHGVISKDDLSLFHFVDSPNEPLEAPQRLTLESEKKCRRWQNPARFAEEPKYDIPKD
jgi:predicted Rossmann-fold nucleotide-binding protein